MSAQTSEVTRLLGHVAEREPGSAERLLSVVYDELRILAGVYLANERVDHTLQPTALVHEAFLRLVDEPDSRWESRAHFYRVAAQAMRRVLVNHARDRRRLKRGGEDAVRVPLDDLDLARDRAPDYIALDESLRRLGAIDPRKEQIVQLRHFGGFTLEETARILDLSIAQVKRDWTLARAFLIRDIDPESVRESS